MTIFEPCQKQTGRKRERERERRERESREGERERRKNEERKEGYKVEKICPKQILLCQADESLTSINNCQ